MQEALLLILFMIIIGAAIGGVTNSLAIKMLFRPYRAYYIGKWKVPFTPGLIPKRRGELANQLGNMVVDHLLTADSLQKKLLNDEFQSEVITWAQDGTKPLFRSEESIEEWLSKLQIPLSTAFIHKHLDIWIEGKVLETKERYKEKSFHDVIPSDLQEKIDQQIPVVVQWITDKAEDYFASEEGRTKIKIMIDDFLKNRGTLGNLLGMFLGNQSIVDKVQPELIKFLKHDGTKEILQKLIQKEWTKLKERKVEELFDYISEEKMINTIQNVAKQALDVPELLSKSLSDVIGRYEVYVTEVLLPSWIHKGTVLLSKQIENIMKKLHLKEIVRDQVESFSIDRVEKMVLDISRREFKMITYLGALLGGIIGLVQGAVILFMG